MATVTSQVTRISSVEGSLTTVSVGGGAGAAANTDIFIQGSQSVGRRQSNTTLSGYLLDTGLGIDLSATSVHVGFWVWHTHYSVLTALRVRMASTTSSNDWDEHIVPLTEYPSLGGWIRVWVDISRTPDATGGSALNEASVQYFGVINSLPSVGGNAANLIMDAVDHTTGGLLLTGTSGVFNDFVSADEGNSTNKYGVITTLSGIMYCRARLTLGSASSLAFTDSNFTLIFPQQNLVENTFMGLTCDLQNASTAITMTGGAISSPGTKKADFTVTGTSGTLSVDSCSFTALRSLTFTSKPTITNNSFINCGQIIAPGTTFTGNTITNYSGTSDTSAVVWDVATNPNGYLDNCVFNRGTGATHAIEFGTTSPTTLDLTGIEFNNYSASNNTASSAIHIKRTTGTVTVNISGGDTPSYKTDGATVSIVSSVTITLTNLKTNTEVRVYTNSGGNNGTEIAGVENSGTSFAFSASPSAVINIMINHINYLPADIWQFTVPSTNTSIPISQITDRQYSNPS